MSIAVKICGIMDSAALQAAVDAGARLAGFVFFPPSKNAITAVQARNLVARVPAHVTKVGLFVDASDDELRAVIGQIPLDLLQLHGHESPMRVAQVRALTGLPVMKALRLRTAENLDAIAAYEPIVDRLLFDSRIGSEPSGGPIDWSLLKGRGFAKPWMLAGGLTAANLAEAIRATGADTVDVSSGVEDEPGHKNLEKIRRFIELAKSL